MQPPQQPQLHQQPGEQALGSQPCVVLVLLMLLLGCPALAAAFQKMWSTC
jgi:hypothetical protein